MLKARTRRPLVFVAIIMAMFMGAIETTIVATSMPTIVSRLGDMSLYSWVFSSYLLMQAVTVPIYGKLSDLFGRKRVFIFGLAVFLLGSVLCGWAESMRALVAFRLIQGMGAGAVLPLAVTLVGDLYSLEERGRVQGYMSSVWGVSSIVGPLSGALIVQYSDWAWVFWVNVPFAVIAIVIIGLYLHEEIERKRHAFDYPGALFMLASLSAAMLALTHAADMAAATLALLGTFAAVMAALFLRQERTAREPIVQLALWKMPLIAVANAATLMAGIAMVGIISFLPTFVQGVLGTSALVAGFALSAMSIGWPLAAITAGRLLVKVGVRKLARAGGIAVFVGSLVIATSAGSGVLFAAMGSFMLGAGFGMLNVSFIVSIQASVPWAQRGAATAANMLMRMLGSAIGSAIFGGLLNFSLQRHINRSGLSDKLSIDDTQSLLGGAMTDGAVRDVLREGLSASLHGVFWGVFIAAAITLAIAWSARELAAEGAANSPQPGRDR